MAQIISTRREIFVSPKIRKEWEALFECDRSTILRALRFQSGSDKAAQIRNYALKQGFTVKNLPYILES